MEVGGRIRKAREALGYSREALAEKADLASSFLGTIELGTGSFTAETMSKLCNCLLYTSNRNTHPEIPSLLVWEPALYQDHPDTSLPVPDWHKAVSYTHLDVYKRQSLGI